MSKKPNQDEQRAAVRDAAEQGLSASEAGVSTGASKQIDHHSHKERSKEDTPRGGKS